MAALMCEICGGKLMGRPGGIFECDSCGMTYDIEWAKAKIQEIKGTVQVEGTVEVTGKVQVDGPVEVKGGVNIESFLKRGQMALEDREWVKASQYFDDALNLDAECVQAHLGNLMAELNVCKQEELKNCAWPFDNRKNYQKVVRFADDSLRSKLQEYLAVICKRNEAPARKKFAVAKGLMATDAFSTMGLRSDGTVLAGGVCSKGRCNVSYWRDIVAIAGGVGHAVGLHSDGTVVATGNDGVGAVGAFKVFGWRDIVAIETGGLYTVGLRADGTVLAVGFNNKGQCNVSSWCDIVAIAGGSAHTVGLRADGTVVAVGDNSKGQCNVSGWSDIVAIAGGSAHTVGLRSDGTVVAVGDNSKGQCNVSNWKLFNSIETIEKEREEAKQRKAEEDRLEAERKAEEDRLEAECKRRRDAGRCQHCGGKLKGFLGKKCVSCGKPKDY